jgi:MarR family transcriptional regulator, lower aerobic nicotinate degradation pathway regulator
MANDSTPRRVSVLSSWLVSKVALEAQRVVADAGVRRQEFAVLAALEEAGATSQADLGRRVWMDRSDLHALIGELEHDGLVTRVVDERDRRRKRVRLTSEGEARLRELQARVDGAQEALLAPLGPDERRELRRLLTRLLDHHRGAR